jgi:hypothetical protein
MQTAAGPLDVTIHLFAVTARQRPATARPFAASAFNIILTRAKGSIAKILEMLASIKCRLTKRNAIVIHADCAGSD